MTASRTWDKVDRPLLIDYGSTISKTTLGYNTAGQVSTKTERDQSYWAYAYNEKGELTSARKLWSDGSPVAGQQFSYGFDSIGNRTASDDGSELGANAQRTIYSANSRNQIVSRQNPASITVIGEATATAAISVNQVPAARRQTYFSATVSADNATPRYQELSVLGVRYDAVSGNDLETTVVKRKFLSPGTESLSYDEAGNLLSDGQWDYEWDSENRLIRMTAKGPVTGDLPAPNSLRRKLEFDYDYVGRRIAKRVLKWDGSAFGLTTHTGYIYDGWTLLGEVNLLANANTLLKRYMWGLDLSNSFAGAGSVGGALALVDLDPAETGTDKSYFILTENNGNIAGLFKPSAGASTVVARYEYGPFGHILRESGASVDKCSLRFSSKVYDPESELLYYGYRYYSPSLGRWISRDPIGEGGGLMLYGFVKNSPISVFDLLGLSTVWHHEYPQELRDFFTEFKVFIDESSCGIFISEKDHHRVHDTLRFNGKSYNEYWIDVKREILSSIEKKSMTPQEAKQAIEGALQRIRSNPKYAAIRRAGAPIPKELSYADYKGYTPDEKNVLFAKVWDAKNSGGKLKYLGEKSFRAGRGVFKLASIGFATMDFRSGASYASEVYDGGAFLQFVAGSSQVIMPFGAADATATWDMSPSEVAAGNDGWGALAETFFNPFSPRWLPTQMTRGALEAITK